MPGPRTDRAKTSYDYLGQVGLITKARQNASEVKVQADNEDEILTIRLHLVSTCSSVGILDN